MTTTPMTPDKNQTDALALVERLAVSENSIHRLGNEKRKYQVPLSVEDRDLIVKALRSSTATGGREIGNQVEAIANKWLREHSARERSNEAVADLLNAILAIRPIGSEVGLPAIPDDDADFTPDLARKIIAKYQQMLATPASGAVGMREALAEGLRALSLMVDSSPAVQRLRDAAMKKLDAALTPLVLGGDDIQTKSQKDSSRSVEGVATGCSFDDLTDFVSRCRQFEIDPEIRDQILKKISACKGGTRCHA